MRLGTSVFSRRLNSRRRGNSIIQYQNARTISTGFLNDSGSALNQG